MAPLRCLVLASLLRATSADAFAALPDQASISLLQVHAERHEGAQVTAASAAANDTLAVKPQQKQVQKHNADAKMKPQAVAEQLVAPQQEQKQKQSAAPKAVAETGAAHDIAMGIKLLRESLTGQFKEAEQAKKQTKASYEANLTQQAKQGHDAMRLNANLTAEVAKVDKANAKLWTQAVALKKECAELQTNIQSLEDNISIAQDFVRETFLRLDNASSDPVLTVLDELEQSDKDTVSTKSHKDKLQAIEGLSMLAISASSSGNDTAKSEEAGGLLKTLGFSLDEASLAEKGAEEHIEAAFQTRFAANSEKLAKLETEREALETDLAAKRERQTKLIAAVQLLTTERDQLLTRRKQAGKYWHQISGRAAGK